MDQHLPETEALAISGKVPEKRVAFHTDQRGITKVREERPEKTGQSVPLGYPSYLS